MLLALLGWREHFDRHRAREHFATPHWRYDPNGDLRLVALTCIAVVRGLGRLDLTMDWRP